MHYLTLLLSASLVVFSAANHLSKEYIIEFDEQISSSTLDIVYSSFQESSVNYQVIKDFKSPGIFIGALVKLDNAEDAIKIVTVPGVRAIRPNKRYHLPRLANKEQIVARRNDPEVLSDTQSTHVMTGVDKLHAEGVVGTGIKIGIIDSGIDYNHPALGAGIGPGHKVIGGYDFVGDAYDGNSTPIPDNDPLDSCLGHGTHVGGIIGADPGNELGISGVAYGACLTAYRVFGCTGGTSEDIIIEALLKGFEDGQDILTLSLGGASGWTESSMGAVIDRIAASGKIVTIAAGNYGNSGSWYTNSPSNAIHAISVASVDNTYLPTLQNLTVHGVSHAPITYYSNLPLPIEDTLPVYATSNDTSVGNDACNPLPDDTPDLSSYIVLIRRGNCTFVQKLSNIAAKGAKFAIIYNNVPGFGSFEFGDFSAALIQDVDGEFIVQQFAAGVPIALSFPQVGGSANFPNPDGGLMSAFSSYGPSEDFYFKPAVAAPGGQILSTYPLALGGFTILSGTSMACPYVAGAAALLLSVKGKTDDIAKSTRSLFESTAQNIPSDRTDGALLQTLIQQGAGLINVYDAIYTTTIVSPTELILNDTAHFAGVQNFTVQNNGDQAKTYYLSHVPAGTALTVQSGSIFTELGPVPLVSAAAAVEISPSTFTVEPGQIQLVEAKFTPPSGLDPSTYPVYSGFIEVNSGSENVRVSYLGLLGSLKDKQVFDTTGVFYGFTLPTILNSTQNPQVGPTNYTFVDTDYPSLLWRLAFGTPKISVDLVEASTDNIPSGSYGDISTIGLLDSYDYLPRNNEDTSEPGNANMTFKMTNATFHNGTSIPNGFYRILMRALRVTGDALDEDDYEHWLSPVLGVEVNSKA